MTRVVSFYMPDKEIHCEKILSQIMLWDSKKIFPMDFDPFSDSGHNYVGENLLKVCCDLNF
jgi:hypothetical protein